jgi:hypothetical protein
MPEIADWLKALGLPEYARSFTENDINFTILGDLTDHDLEKIGVASLGHRRKLLRAIAALHAGGGAGPPHCLRPRRLRQARPVAELSTPRKIPSFKAGPRDSVPKGCRY